MDVQTAYNQWAEKYDSNRNRTRDLEAVALKRTLERIEFSECLEVGCGTGKNTEWLILKAEHLIAVDLSEAMLSIAKEKVQSDKVSFKQADINKPWEFTEPGFNLITFSLVLEHIANLDHVFREASRFILPEGYLYLGELHPYKQYLGTKARFETEKGIEVVNCFNHHISDFTEAALANGFELIYLNEYFDEDDRSAPPRILTILFKKK